MQDDRGNAISRPSATELSRRLPCSSDDWSLRVQMCLPIGVARRAAVTLFFLVALMFLALVLVLFMPGLLGLIPAAFLLLPSVAVSVYVIAGYLRHHRRATIAACREYPVCLQCLFKLRGLMSEPDGCTVCPECGAAWRLASTDPGAHKVDRA
ncbi:MAG: hypothetical protein AAGK04_05910 [Planctomycetota bacterium]